MSNQPPVVVAIDLPLAPDTEQLARLASQSGWMVHALHVAPATASDAEVEALSESLSPVTAIFAAEGVDATTAVIRGSTVGTVLDEADRLDAPLIAVLSTSFRSTPWPDLGSVTSALLKVSTRPVLVVPVSGGPAQPGFVAALDRLVSLIDRTEDDPELEELKASALHQLESNGDVEEASLTHRIRKAITSFETEHPQLTRAVNDVAYYLSGLGI